MLSDGIGRPSTAPTSGRRQPVSSIYPQSPTRSVVQPLSRPLSSDPTRQGHKAVVCGLPSALAMHFDVHTNARGSTLSMAQPESAVRRPSSALPRREVLPEVPAGTPKHQSTSVYSTIPPISRKVAEDLSTTSCYDRSSAIVDLRHDKHVHGLDDGFGPSQLGSIPSPALGSKALIRSGSSTTVDVFESNSRCSTAAPPQQAVAVGCDADIRGMLSPNGGISIEFPDTIHALMAAGVFETTMRPARPPSPTPASEYDTSIPMPPMSPRPLSAPLRPTAPVKSSIHPATVPTPLGAVDALPSPMAVTVPRPKNIDPHCARESNPLKRMAQPGIDALQREVSDLRAQLKASRAQTSAARGEAAASKGQISTLRKELSRVTSDAAVLSRRLGERTEDAVRLRRELDLREGAFADRASAAASARDASAAVAALGPAVAEAERRAASACAAAESADLLRAREEERATAAELHACALSAQLLESVAAADAANVKGQLGAMELREAEARRQMITNEYSDMMTILISFVTQLTAMWASRLSHNVSLGSYWAVI